MMLFKHVRKPTYLEAAAYALRKLRRPASAAEITSFLQSAKKYQSTLAGATPHRTIQARIATDIKTHGPNSRFFRIAPAVFALRELSELGEYSPSPKRIFVGFNRSKQIDNTPVCTIDLNHTRFRPATGFSDSNETPLRLLSHLPVKYRTRRETRFDSNLLVVNVFINVLFEDQVLCFEPTSYLEDNDTIKNKDSIGITGYLFSDDSDLFDQSGLGFRNATIREFYDFFHLLYKDCHKLVDRIDYFGSVYDDFSEDRRRRLGLVSIVHTKEKMETDGIKLGVRNMHWRHYTSIPNSYFRLEPWSQYVFRNLCERYRDGSHQ
ncbi:MAG: winged helix-turn-helix domain-containing protein [Mesorhizobium sp.]|nr:winged helix-turn-helix domain-containing protein [Mesorhizobium sp.]MBL8577039.1 winged helix-turn-helix domain-containing protein [Mesorhizobium sp.]